MRLHTPSRIAETRARNGAKRVISGRTAGTLEARAEGQPCQGESPANLEFQGFCTPQGRVGVLAVSRATMTRAIPHDKLASDLRRRYPFPEEKSYRPSIEQLKKRYAADMARRKMQARRDMARDPGARKVRTPDNSEPWLPDPVRSVADAMRISDQITADMREWKLL